MFFNLLIGYFSHCSESADVTKTEDIGETKNKRSRDIQEQQEQQPSVDDQQHTLLGGPTAAVADSEPAAKRSKLSESDMKITAEDSKPSAQKNTLNAESVDFNNEDAPTSTVAKSPFTTKSSIIFGGATYAQPMVDKWKDDFLQLLQHNDALLDLVINEGSVTAKGAYGINTCKSIRDRKSQPQKNDKEAETAEVNGKVIDIKFYHRKPLDKDFPFGLSHGNGEKERPYIPHCPLGLAFLLWKTILCTKKIDKPSPTKVEVYLKTAYKFHNLRFFNAFLNAIIWNIIMECARDLDDLATPALAGREEPAVAATIGNAKTNAKEPPIRLNIQEQLDALNQKQLATKQEVYNTDRNFAQLRVETATLATVQTGRDKPAVAAPIGKAETNAKEDAPVENQTQLATKHRELEEKTSPQKSTSFKIDPNDPRFLAMVNKKSSDIDKCRNPDNFITEKESLERRYNDERSKINDKKYTETRDSRRDPEAQVNKDHGMLLSGQVLSSAQAAEEFQAQLDDLTYNHEAAKYLDEKNGKKKFYQEWPLAEICKHGKLETAAQWEALEGKSVAELMSEHGHRCSNLGLPSNPEDRRSRVFTYSRKRVQDKDGLGSRSETAAEYLNRLKVAHGWTAELEAEVEAGEVEDEETAQRIAALEAQLKELKQPTKKRKVEDVAQADE